MKIISPTCSAWVIFFLLFIHLSGFATDVVIDGKVFVDQNKNNTLDGNEAGIERIHIRIFYWTNTSRWKTLLTTTSSKGTYSFAITYPNYESGFKYTVVELGPNPGPAVSNGTNPNDFNYNDPAMPGGFNGTTTLRRQSGPDVLAPRDRTYNFGHAQFATFPQNTTNALIVTSASSQAGSKLWSLDLATGNTNLLLEPGTPNNTNPIAGLGYSPANGVFMGCYLKDETKGGVVLIENTSPLKVTRLPLGEGVFFYIWAMHNLDISPDGFMYNFEQGTGTRYVVLDVRPTSINYLQLVDPVTKNFTPDKWSNPFQAQPSGYTDMAFHPSDNHRYYVGNQPVGSVLKMDGAGQVVNLGPVSYANCPPFPNTGFFLPFFAGDNTLFVVSTANKILYRIDLRNRFATKVSDLSVVFSDLYLLWVNGASNGSVLVPMQANNARKSSMGESLQEATVLVAPNPARGRLLQLTYEPGISSVAVFSGGSMPVVEQNGNGSSKQDVILPATIVTGNYILRVTGNDGKVVNKHIVVE